MSGYVVIRVDTTHYGWIHSIHVDVDAASEAIAVEADGIRAVEPHALIDCMFQIIPIADNDPVGQIGERIRWRK